MKSFEPGQAVRIKSAHPEVGGNEGLIVEKTITGEYKVKVGKKNYTISGTLLTPIKSVKESFSFKQFTTFVDLDGEPTDTQITEIFGIFQNNKKIDKLKADREKLKADTAAKVAAWRAKKEGKPTDDEEEDDPKGKTAVKPYPAAPRAAAAGRAAERDWTSNMAAEGAFTNSKKDRDPKYCEVFAEIAMADGREIELRRDSLEDAIKELTPLKDKKLNKDWHFNGRDESILVTNFSGAERRFKGAQAINKFLETYVGAEEVKGFRNTIL